MRNSKNKILFFASSMVLIGSITLSSCKSTTYTNTRIDGKNLEVTEIMGSDQAMETFITPYRNHIDTDLSKVISYTPVAMDRSIGTWESSIGNLFAEATLEEVNPVFYKRTGNNIDIAMLNYGGIRSVISQGDVTTRTAFEVMPFENSAIVVELRGQQIMELAQYMIKNKTAHPLAGITIYINKNEEITKVLIGNKPLDLNKNYFVVTNDYLALGGDRMIFFAKAIQKFDMDYKLRNVLLAYFKSHNPLPVITTKHIIEE